MPSATAGPESTNPPVVTVHSGVQAFGVPAQLSVAAASKA
jgi:hypothetical protein